MRSPPLTTDDPRFARRLDIGLALLASDAAGDAVDAFRAALELDPGNAEARFCLAEALEAAGDSAAAIESFRACLSLDPDDRLGAVARLARLGAVAPLARLPAAYVRTLFDQYAGRFDDALVGGLNYCGPQLLCRALDRAPPMPAGGLVVLDLGCGTGLAGLAIRDRAAWLEGIDLSPEMIARARARGVYDALRIADLVTALETAGRRYDLILAADVLIYFGDLAPVFAAAAKALRPGGRFALTTEHADGTGYRLGDHLRFAHSVPYLHQTSAQAGLAIELLEPGSSRTEARQPVPGLVAVLRAPAEIASASEIALAPDIGPPSEIALAAAATAASPVPQPNAVAMPAATMLSPTTPVAPLVPTAALGIATASGLPAAPGEDSILSHPEPGQGN